MQTLTSSPLHTLTLVEQCKPSLTTTLIVFHSKPWSGKYQQHKTQSLDEQFPLITVPSNILRTYSSLQDSPPPPCANTAHVRAGVSLTIYIHHWSNSVCYVLGPRVWLSPASLSILKTFIHTRSKVIGYYCYGLEGLAPVYNKPPVRACRTSECGETLDGRLMKSLNTWWVRDTATACSSEAQASSLYHAGNWSVLGVIKKLS